VAPAAGSNSSRLSDSASAAPASYFTPLEPHNHNNPDGAAQYMRVVTSNAPIQPKLLLGRYCFVIANCYSFCGFFS